MSANVVTSQPTPTAPPSEHLNLEKPSAPIEEIIIISQPLLNGNNELKPPNDPDNFIFTQPMLDENMEDMLNRAEEDGAEKERRRQRNLDYCCFACADSYVDNDPFCWYFFCRMLCNGCGYCCEGIAHCTDSCCEGCAECCNSCCEACCCEDGGCCDDSGNVGDGGCCDGDCDCDCSCFD